MCGIAGFISQNKDYDGHKIVSRMLNRLNHRGPDQRGVADFDDLSLGMVRLSIIDQVEHPVPFTDDTGLYAIAYNGEIYNHQSIKSSISNKYRFHTDSDTETTLLNFIEHGPSSFEELNGMYAFAIYDSTKKETYIVRDKVGEKPLYYTEGKDFFAFASEIKALLEVTPAQFNEEAISYKAYEFTVGKETMFKNIFQLEPGEYIKYSNCKKWIHSYWKIWNNLLEIEDDKQKIIKDLSELLEDSILLRTNNCSHKYAALISGGVDSALIASIAKPDFIYTSHYDFPDFDELEFARMVAKQIGKKLQVIAPTKNDFINTKDKIAYHLDEPCTWTSFTLWMLLDRLAKDGIKVVMTGDGADEIFGGYHRYHLLNHDEQIRQLEAMKNYEYLINKYYGDPVERYSKIVNRYHNTFDQEVNTYLYHSIGFYFNKMEGDVVHLMGLNDFYSTMQILLQMTDRISMAFSMENRSPFLDYRLVQYAFSMPSKYKIKNGISKWILKEIAKKFIPKPIVDRKDKRGFSAPVNRWFEWDKKGKYDRSAYRQIAFDAWCDAFEVNKALPAFNQYMN